MGERAESSPVRRVTNPPFIHSISFRALRLQLHSSHQISVPDIPPDRELGKLENPLDLPLQGLAVFLVLDGKVFQQNGITRARLLPQNAIRLLQQIRSALRLASTLSSRRDYRGIFCTRYSQLLQKPTPRTASFCVILDQLEENLLRHQPPLGTACMFVLVDQLGHTRLLQQSCPRTASFSVIVDQLEGTQLFQQPAPRAASFSVILDQLAGILLCQQPTSRNACFYVFHDQLEGTQLL